MGTTYSITINMKVLQGMVELGRFSIGTSKPQAVESFERLAGEHKSALSAVLRLDLVERRKGIDVVLGRISCTLEQFIENCRSITVDAFKYFNLEA